MSGRKGRLFFSVNSVRSELGPDARDFDVLKSYAPKGFFNSGKHYLVIRRLGGTELVTEREAQQAVSLAVETKVFCDKLDPGYNS